MNSLLRELAVINPLSTSTWTLFIKFLFILNFNSHVNVIEIQMKLSVYSHFTQSEDETNNS